MPNVITGAGTLNQVGSGVTTLSGNSSTFAGTTNVNAGSLLVTGSLGGTVNVNSGALLGGTGTVGTAGLTTSIASGGQLSPGLSPGTLTIAGNLSLAAGSITNFELRTPGVAGGVGPGANDLVNVNGNLSIANGAILNVNAPVSGSYRLFNVNGTITPGGGANLGFTTINTIGGLYTATLFQTAGTPNEVNLLLASAGQIVQAFDGADLTGAQAGAQGGAGVWGGTTTNWTQNPNGVLNDRWLGQVGVFGGAAGGAVNVSGPVNFQGLQFTANGYVLSGGAINAVGNGVGGGNAMASFLNIDPGVTATIAGSITGAAGVGLDKLGRGTLVLSGANLHSGMTDIQAGVVTIRNGAALGAGDGAATTGTRVRTEAALEIAGGITVANEALFLNGGGIANGGALRSLSGANLWNGPVTLEATSRINTDSGTFTIGGAIGGAGRSLTIGGAGATIVNGAIATGAGALTHDGAGTLTLNGANSFTGLTANLSGTLTNNGSLAGGVSNAATFSNAGAIGTWLVNSAQATNLAGGTIAQGVTNSGSFGNSGTIGGPLLNTSKASNLSDGSIGQGVTNSGTFDNAGAVSGGLSNAGTASNLVTGSIHQGVTNRAGFSNFGTVNGGLVNLAKASNLAGGTIHQGVTNGGFLDSKGAIHGGLANEGEFRAAGQLNGAVVNRPGGLFTVTGALGGVMQSFDNAGIVGIGAGAITGVGAFRNNGLLMASDGGARTLGAATFSNQSSGMVTQANGQATDVLSITGDFVGATGSRILQDINLAQPRGAATNGDRIMVGGSASGTTTFIFTPTNESRAAFGDPIPVFTTTGENSMAANEGKIGHLGQGFFDYFLRRNAMRTGFEIASSYNSTPAAGVAGSLGGLTSSHQASFNQSFSSIVPRATDCRPNQAIGSPFIRMGTGGLASRTASAGEMSGGTLTFSGSARSNATVGGFQAGFDLGLCNLGASGWSVHAGLTGGVAEITATSLSRASTPVPGLEVSSRTRATANTPFVGIYGFATNGAFTAEFDIRRDFHDIKLSSSDASTGFIFVNPHQRLKGDGLSFNGALSYRIAIGERFHIEPQVGLSKGRTSFGLLPFATGRQDFLRIDPMASLMGRIGLDAGASFALADRITVAPFVSGSLWHEFARPIRTQSSIGSPAQAFVAETDRTGTFGQLGAGLKLSHGDGALAGFVRGDLRFGEKTSGQALNAGIRLTF